MSVCLQILALPILLSGLLTVAWVSTIKIIYRDDQCRFTTDNASLYYRNNSIITATKIIDPRLKLSHFTISGTHNSYHKQGWFYPYEHSSLESQLDAGVRQVELDIHIMANGNAIYHLQIVDDNTNCYCLNDCLRRIRRWSDRNPNHTPIFVFFEIKEKFYEDFFIAANGGVKCHHIEDIKKQILAVFPTDSLILADQIQGNYSSISLALKRQKENELNGNFTYDNYGWPPMSLSLGKIVPVLLDDAYNRAPELFGTCEAIQKFLLVAQSSLDPPYASIICISTPFNQRQTLIAGLAKGLITRLLLGYGDSRLIDKYTEARKYGIHIVSTDSAQCDGTPLCRSIAADFPKSASVLCNTLTAPNFCSGAFSDPEQ